MKCPVCTNVNLVMAERQGIEIDYCPECRGVWLDRGELDKIIERTTLHHEKSEAGSGSRYNHPEQPPPRQHENQPYQHGRHDHKGHGGYGYGHHHKKKKSLLSELFDFD